MGAGEWETDLSALAEDDVLEAAAGAPGVLAPAVAGQLQGA